MRTALHWDPKLGGGLVVLYPDGNTFFHYDLDTLGGRKAYVLEKVLGNEDWMNRMLAKAEKEIQKEKREAEYQKLRDKPVKI